MSWDIVLKLLPLLGIPAVLGAWHGGVLGSLLPPLPRILRAGTNYVQHWWNLPAHKLDDSRYHLVICALEGDDAKESTLRLLEGALNPRDYPMLRVTLSARCISL